MEEYAQQYAEQKVAEALKNRPCPKCGKASECPKPPPPEQLPCKPVEQPSSSSSRGGRGGFGGKKAAATNCARDCPCSDRDDCIAESECSARRDAQLQQACPSGVRVNDSEVWHIHWAFVLIPFSVNQVCQRYVCRQPVRYEDVPRGDCFVCFGFGSIVYRSRFPRVCLPRGCFSRVSSTGMGPQLAVPLPQPPTGQCWHLCFWARTAKSAFCGSPSRQQGRSESN